MSYVGCHADGCVNQGAPYTSSDSDGVYLCPCCGGAMGPCEPRPDPEPCEIAPPPEFPPDWADPEPEPDPENGAAVTEER